MSTPWSRIRELRLLRGITRDRDQIAELDETIAHYVRLWRAQGGKLTIVK